MVSRTEFYSTVALVLLFPAALFLASGGPQDALRFVLTLVIAVGMIGLSIGYSVLAIRERGGRSSVVPDRRPSR